MPPILAEHPLPLRVADDGVILVARTRIPVDIVLWHYRNGESPEEIVDQHPSLGLDDVYSVIGYYLANRVAIDSYLAERERSADAVQAENDARCDPAEIRARLLERRAEMRRAQESEEST